MRYQIISCMLAMGLLAGCATIKTSYKSSTRPVWTDAGNGFYKGPRGVKAFHGVGQATNISSTSLRRSTADAQARAELAKQFRSQVKNLVKLYSAAFNAGAKDRESSEQMAQEATKVFSELELTGSVVIDHWLDSETNTEFSLAMLDAESFKDSIAQLKQLSKELRDTIQQNAEKAWQELDEESAKSREQ